MMTPRQIEPLRYVWACAQASFHNAHFSQDGLPFLPEDFMRDGARMIRKAESIRTKQDVAKANRRAEMMRPGETTGVPKWAIEAKGAVN